MKEIKLCNKRKKIDKDILDTDNKIVELTKWIESNINTEVNYDENTEPKIPIEKQLLHLLAEDSSIDDTFFILEHALEFNKLDLASFIKIARSLSREQFFIKATINKIHQQRGVNLNSKLVS